MCLRAVIIVLLTQYICAATSQYYQLPRVLGGSPTNIQKYPILAQLLLDPWGTFQYMQHCAGVILTSRHVISTAHCFQYNPDTGMNYSQPQLWRIRVGSTFRTRGGVLHKVQSIIPHKDFDRHFYTNDIAIVVVARKFSFGSTIRQGTITKPNTEIAPNSLCTLVGWGVTEKDGEQPDQLQHTMMFTVDVQECRLRYNTIGAIITDSMICAGRIDIDGIDGCFGDSGGPLIYKGVVVGLVSFGYACGIRYYPGVYTKISHYTNWIVKTITKNK